MVVETWHLLLSVSLCRVQGPAILESKGTSSREWAEQWLPRKVGLYYVFESNGNNMGSFSWAPFPVLYLAVHLEYVSTYSVCPGLFRRQFPTFKEYLPSLFLRQTLGFHRTAFPLFGFVFLFFRETSCPAKLYSCAGSELPPFLNFPPIPTESLVYNWYSPAELELCIASSEKLLHHFYLCIHHKYLYTY